MVHVDAMSHHPVDPAESMGPDTINNQHQHMNHIVNNIEDEDDNDDDDNIEVQVDDPLCSGLFHAAQHHQGYQQAIREMQDGEKIDWKELPTGSYIRQLKGQVHRWSEKYTSGNAKSNESFTIPAKVLAIRPNTHERSAILELCDGRTTIRDRLHCCIDPTQPQPDNIDNIEECDASYLKLITKPQVSNKDEQQIIDLMHYAAIPM